MIRPKMVDDVGAPARPSDFEPVDLGRVSDPEVCSKIALTQIAGLLPHGGEESGADAVTVARVPDQLHEHGMSAVSPIVAQEIDGLAVVGDEQIEVAVVFDIADDERATDPLDREARVNSQHTDSKKS
jgi:hypothetical protein